MKLLLLNFAIYLSILYFLLYFSNTLSDFLDINIKILYNFNPQTECSAVWLAHLVWDQGVGGSSPSTPTT